jgi:crotonobetainyl-CoA:carnitine CoA-transferase CaiB-like acyl-CoA transferase
MTQGPLKDLKVLELSSFVAGPYCAKLLADFGAEVVKIEAPGVGDEARRREPFMNDTPNPELSGLFLYLNNAKLGITLDIETSVGRDIFKQLIAWCDILIEDRTPGELAGLGLDYATLKGLNPALIMTSITPFGQTGPYSTYKAYYLNTFHASGQGYLLPMFSLDRSRAPLRYAGYVGEYDAGLSAAIATLGALYWRGNGGTGQHIDVSKQHAVMHLEKSQLRRYVDSGESPDRTGMGRLLETVVKCKDGYYVTIILSSEIQWRGLFEAMGRPQWGQDPPFNTQAGRSDHYTELREHLQEWTNHYTAEEIFHKIQGCRSACGLVQTAEQVYRSPQFEARGYFDEIDHPMAGKLKHPGRPYQFSNVSWRANKPAPLLGQHNEEVFCNRLGYQKRDLVKLRESGVI